MQSKLMALLAAGALATIIPAVAVSNGPTPIQLEKRLAASRHTIAVQRSAIARLKMQLRTAQDTIAVQHASLAAVPKPAPTTSATLRVGVDIQPGTYQNPSPGALCYWARLSGFGGTFDEIIANDNVSGPAIVTIAPTDVGFTYHDCAGAWVRIG